MPARVSWRQCGARVSGSRHLTAAAQPKPKPCPGCHTRHPLDCKPTRQRTDSEVGRRLGGECGDLFQHHAALLVPDAVALQLLLDLRARPPAPTRRNPAGTPTVSHLPRTVLCAHTAAHLEQLLLAVAGVVADVRHLGDAASRKPAPRTVSLGGRAAAQRHGAFAAPAAGRARVRW